MREDGGGAGLAVVEEVSEAETCEGDKDGDGGEAALERECEMLSALTAEAACMAVVEAKTGSRKCSISLCPPRADGDADPAADDREEGEDDERGAES